MFKQTGAISMIRRPSSGELGCSIVFLNTALLWERLEAQVDFLCEAGSMENCFPAGT